MQLLSPATGPYDLGQLVTIDNRGERLPGTVVDVRPEGPGRWGVHVEVLVSFGVGGSHHLVDDLGHEVDRRAADLGLVARPMIAPIEEFATAS